MSEEQVVPEFVAPEVITSTVEVQGNLTIRTYNCGTIQRNTWETPEIALEFAKSVEEQGA